MITGQFNEAILHFLAFQKNPRPYCPSHYTSCQQSCNRLTCIVHDRCLSPNCRDYGICNATYARNHLQARIVSEKRLETPFQGFYHSLREAIARFRTDLERPEACFFIVRSQFNNDAFFPCTSQNPVFCDKTSMSFCEATLLLLDLRSKGQYRPPWDKDLICWRRACFWLKNLACFFGNVEMLQFYMDESCDSKFSENCKDREKTELLGMAAARGHETLFKFLLPSVKPDRIHMALALRGACYSGNVNITKTILSTVRGEDLEKLCSQPLSGWRHSIRLSPNYPAVAAIIDDCYKQNLKQFSLLRASDQANSVEYPSNHDLLQHSQGRTAILWPPNRRSNSRSILWHACLNGDLTAVRILLSDDTSDEFPPLMQTMNFKQVAVHSNSFSICEELCRFTGFQVHQMRFHQIAALDGSIEAMSKHLELNPGILDRGWSFALTETFAQIALRFAAERLRVENVRFLLDRGARISRLSAAPCIHWRYRRANEENFQAIQYLLGQHNSEKIQVWI